MYSPGTRIPGEAEENNPTKQPIQPSERTGHSAFGRQRPVSNVLPQSLDRSMYSPVAGFTLIRSPTAMNSGTFTDTPFDSTAGLLYAVLVAVFITGDVSLTSSTRYCGRSMPIGRPS